MIERKNKRIGRIGIFAVAHSVYWDQFDGLEDNIMGFHKDFCKMVEDNDIEVVDFGMIDSNEKAFEAVPRILAADVDVLFCNMVTYATSSVFAPIIKQVDKPMVLVALQPRKAMDYTKACTFMQLENDNICSVPEFTGVAIRMGKKVNDVILGSLYDDDDAKKQLILNELDTPDPGSDPVATKLTDEDLTQAAHTAVALDKFIEKYNLTGLAYYYEGKPDTLQRTVATTFIVGNSILNAQGIPMCGEFDVKTCIAMLIMDRLNIGGSFAEFHPFDFNEDFILVGHDGPHHLRIAEGKPVLRSLSKYHGKPGHGASVEFKIKEGPITMLGITQKADGSFKFVIGEGYSKEGPIPPTGNTNTRGFFKPTTKEFIKKWVMEGPTHHYALGVGHHAETIAKIADILGIESVIVR